MRLYAIALPKESNPDLYCNDIFETGQISPRIRFQTQNVTNHYSCFREFGVSFTYKFGGYKEKQREGVDTSRFNDNAFQDNHRATAWLKKNK